MRDLSRGSPQPYKHRLEISANSVTSGSVSCVPFSVDVVVMGLMFLLAVLVTVSYLPSCSQAASCAATLCMTNSICREILDRSTGVISAHCLDPTFYPLTGNEQICSDGQPLWIVNSNRRYSEAACGRVIDRTTCPSGYTCEIAPNDAYSLCCPSSFAK